MLGTFDFSKKECVVIGGGVSGLLITYRLLELGFKVELHEATGRLGGLIHTSQLNYGIAEAAAHSFLASPDVISLCKKLGVELSEVNKDSHARYIFRDGRARRVPLNIIEILKTIFKIFSARADVDTSQMNMQEWGLKFIGSAALQFALNPFIRGIYGARPSELTVGAAFSKLAVAPGYTLFGYFKLRKKLVPPAPKASMVAPLKGMGDLISNLEVAIRKHSNAKVFLNSKISVLPQVPNVAICTEARSAAELIGVQRTVSYAPIVSVTAIVKSDRRWKGVGALVPESQTPRCMGILFNSSAFRERVKNEAHHQSYTLMFGGSADPEFIKLSEDEIRIRVMQAFKEILKNTPEIIELKIHKWERAIPKYGKELEAFWEAMRTNWCLTPGHVLFGNYTGQVSIRGMIEDVARLR